MDLMLENVTFTRPLAEEFDSLEKEFAALVSKEDLIRCVTAYSQAYLSDRGSKLQKLYKMLELGGLAYERGRDAAYYRALIDRSGLPHFYELEDWMIHSLYLRYLKYPSPTDYMKRLVDRLEKDPWKDDPLRLRILKQFIKYGDWLRDAGVGGRLAICSYVKEKTALRKKPATEQVLADLDDGVFALLAAASAPQRRPGGKYGLLKIADDLAQGTFRAEGTTRRYLYWFAIVYDMTYYSGSTSRAEVKDTQRDIEINLFRDYYNNNLIRFISASYLQKPTESELDPSGQGINYKNFAEMIYLYWLCKDLAPQDKIRGAEAMIEEVKDRQAESGPVDTKAAGGTAYFRQLARGSRNELFTGDILGLDEEPFKDFLCAHYDCDVYRNSYVQDGETRKQPVSPMTLQAEQKSAYDEYKLLRRPLSRESLMWDRLALSLWLTEVAESAQKHIDAVCARWPDTDRAVLTSFMDLLRAASRFIDLAAGAGGAPAGADLRKTWALHVPDARYVTRTSLLVAYYYTFIVKYFKIISLDTAAAVSRLRKVYFDKEEDESGPDENDKAKDEPGPGEKSEEESESRPDEDPEGIGRFRWSSYAEVFNAFKAGVDPCLERAYYQPLSSKNLFDVLITFSAYAYLNL